MLVVGQDLDQNWHFRKIGWLLTCFKLTLHSSNPLSRIYPSFYVHPFEVIGDFITKKWVQYHLDNITLDSGIDVSPWINVAPLLKYFNIRILIHFYIKQGIAVIFHFFSFIFFSKIIKRTPMFIPESRVELKRGRSNFLF